MQKTNNKNAINICNILFLVSLLICCVPVTACLPPNIVFFRSTPYIIYYCRQKQTPFWISHNTPTHLLSIFLGCNINRENLSYIPSRFAFKLSHVNFPTCINCLHTTLYKLSAITKHALPTFVVLTILQCVLVNQFTP